jgi:hypothetical protein
MNIVPSVRITIALALAGVALLIYGGRSIDPNKFGLDPTVVLSQEEWKGVPFTGSTINAIITVAERQRQAKLSVEPPCKPTTILWLGNSQLHFINQFQWGEHVAPFWLRKSIDCPDAFIPLGVSLPNASLQEHYVLAEYFWRRFPIRTVILQLCFDDLREDGLREEFAELLTPQDREILQRNEVGSDILARADANWKGRNRSEENSGLEGFVQKNIEDEFNARLGDLFSLWKDRANLRNLLLTDLYYTRNALLGIKPTSVRKMIPPRYHRNMQAYAAILQEAERHRIRVVAYIAPIRQDHSLPYDRSQYEAWKQQIAAMTTARGAISLNLERIIPNELWGSYHGEDVDFMHFRGKGHELLAQALLPQVAHLEKGKD